VAQSSGFPNPTYLGYAAQLTDGSGLYFETTISRPHPNGAVALFPPTEVSGSTAAEFVHALRESIDQLFETATESMNSRRHNQS
jgi:hypothetical protein